MYSTDSAPCSQEVPRETIVKNTSGIRNLHLDDLFYLEQDLDFYEKVSVVFLLYANDRSQYKCILQQLLALSLEQRKQSDLLRTWARSISEQNLKWNDTLVEALCLIQAKRVIHRLGLDFHELNERYLPANHYISSHIPVIVKLLYFVCEQLTVKQCKRLIDYITGKYEIVRNCVYAGSDNGEHLEIYLLHWLLENVIDVGQTNEQSDEGMSNSPCNLEPIVQWLKEAEMDSLREIVLAVIKKFNGKATPILPTFAVQTDDKQATSFGEPSRVISNSRPQTADTNNVYKIRFKSAGIVLIINQNKFHLEKNPRLKAKLPSKLLEERKGTDRDAEALEQTFKKFGYRVRSKEDRLDTQILDDVRDVINDSADYDSVIVCILSHGQKGFVYGSNCTPVEIDEIEKIIKSDRMIGKPKILIVQACQGDVTQRALEIEPQRNLLCHDGPSMSIHSDFLKCGSTVDGFTSIRHMINGSWFIQTLCKKVQEFANRKHFVDILTKVNREVMDKRGLYNECMVPIFHSTLRFDLHFPFADGN